MSAVSMFSGGIGSFLATQRYLEHHPEAEVVLLFTDTKTEDADLYRFLDDATRYLTDRFPNTGLKTLTEGRDIWQVFRDERMLGNSRIDPCSRILKRDLSRKWIEDNVPENADLIFGYAWDEIHRHERTKYRWAPRPVVSPMTEPPYLSKADMIRELEWCGIIPPRLYRLGFSHNNCGGGCVKAGIGHFTHLLRVLPEVYASWEANEQALRDELGDVSILRDRTDGDTTRMTLTALRERVQAGESLPMFDIGGCACFEEPADSRGSLLAASTPPSAPLPPADPSLMGTEYGPLKRSRAWKWRRGGDSNSRGA